MGLDLIFNTTWVVLIVDLKVNILREMTFNFTLVGSSYNNMNIARTVHIAAYL